MRKQIKIKLFALLTIIYACSSNINETNEPSNNPSNNYSEWSVPVGEIRDGGPGIDGIPSIDHPQFVNINNPEASYLNDEDLIVGIVDGTSIKAYPHIILDWHEIINDNLNGVPTSISYCPLTGTAFAWKGDHSSSNPEYGVSGLLYKSNLILYDRETNSHWSQLRLDCINGELIGNEPELKNIIETNWGTWKTMYPNTKVMTLNTGFNRDYDEYPYGPYKTDHDFFLFNVSPLNNNLPNKERVFAIIDNGYSKVYRFSSFQNGKVLKEIINNKTFLIVGNENTINAFELTGSLMDLEYEYVYNHSQSFFSDSEGNEWTISGKAISGLRENWQLKHIKSLVSYWFAIAAFYPQPDIYQN
ncbi:DUF3179 domain-containing protein [Pontimicrobium sp. IMCC45349]|uniref:DUF3179 domain-containing protein n=1 Tax=Pontimicrobium sp. IMCC45349 TaxID=3391574 RepID=UPI0039A096C9